MNKRDIGTLYEEKSINILKKNGFIILDKNYRIPRAEIDIIAKKENLIIFVEVKYRRTSNYGYGSEAVDSKKIDKICLAAKNYIQEHKYFSCDFRIDCMSYLKDELTWIKNITLGG